MSLSQGTTHGTRKTNKFRHHERRVNSAAAAVKKATD